eukprot:11496024-Alexandrium_andersonii.AAC.1
MGHATRLWWGLPGTRASANRSASDRRRSSSNHEQDALSSGCPQRPCNRPRASNHAAAAAVMAALWLCA